MKKKKERKSLTIVVFNFRFSYNIYKTFLIIVVRIEIENSKEYNKGLLYLFNFLKT